MGWEVITDNLPEGSTLEELPAGYTIDRAFLNAFFIAIKERVGVTSTYTPEDMEEMIFDTQDDPEEDPNQYTGIGTQELQRRLVKLNDIVKSMITPIFNQSSGIINWFVEDYITQIKGGEEVFGYETPNEFYPFTLNRDSDRFWIIDDVRSLISDDVYDAILDEDNSYKFKEATYWSGIYLLIKYVFIAGRIGSSFNTETNENSLRINEPERQEGGYRYSEKGYNAVTFNTTPLAWINQFITDAYSNGTTGVAGVSIGADFLCQSRYYTQDVYSTPGRFSDPDRFDEHATTECVGRMSCILNELQINIPNEIDVYYTITHGDRRSGGYGRRALNSRENLDQGRLREDSFTVGDITRTATIVDYNAYTYTPSEEAFFHSAWISLTGQLATYTPATETDPAFTVVDYSFNEPLDMFLGEGYFAQGEKTNGSSDFGADDRRVTLLSQSRAAYDPIFVIKQDNLEYPV